MSFAELSSAIPRAGGAYNFARIGFGRGASFIYFGTGRRYRGGGPSFGK